METIKNYLEAMFTNMPDTDSVRKAKSELLSMMEDKYNELIADGASENSAVGTVISEFGNLDELADDLGLKNEIVIMDTALTDTPRRFVSLNEAKEYLVYQSKSALMVAVGVLLCILSVTGPLFSDLAGLNEVYGITFMFLFIAVAVGFFVYNSIIGSKWKYMKTEPIQIDMATADFIADEKTRYSSTHALMLTIGIVLCVICWLPTVILGDLSFENIGAILLFVTVAIGVFMIIYSNTIYGSYDSVLKANARGTIGASYANGKKVEYINDVAKLIMELYWPVITSCYLVWSFVTFAWWKTWIIWPVAGIIHAVLNANLKKN